MLHTDKTEHPDETEHQDRSVDEATREELRIGVGAGSDAESIEVGAGEDGKPPRNKRNKKGCEDAEPGLGEERNGVRR